MLIGALLALKQSSLWVSACLVTGAVIVNLSVFLIWAVPFFQGYSHYPYDAIFIWPGFITMIGWLVFAVGFLGLVVQGKKESQNNQAS